MSIHLTVRAAAVGLFLSLLASGKAIAVTFSFTKIADTSNNSFTSSASINNEGTVAFRASNPSSASIVTGNGNQLNTIFSYDVLRPGFDDRNAPTINNTGTVAFGYTTTVSDNYKYQQETVYTAKQGNISRLSFETNIYNTGFSSPAINDSGTIVFRSNFQFFNSLWASNGEETTLLTASTATTGISLNFLSDVAINNVGTIAFSGTIYDPSRRDVNGRIISFGPDSRMLTGVFTTNMSSLGDIKPILLKNDTLESFDNSSHNIVAINDQDTVAFVANQSTGGASLFTIGSNGLLTKIADTSSAFKNFNNVAINDQGTVAFAATLNTGGQGIFVGSAVTDKVIATGDSLFGSTVTNVQFTSRGLNDRSSVAFFATLANGNSGIFRADFQAREPKPIPEQTSTLGLLALSFIIGLGCKRIM